MSFLDHESTEEVSEARYHAEKKLDAVYHAIPEWVHRLFPDKSLAEKIALGFDYQQQQWTDTFLSEVKAREHASNFLIFVMRTYGIDYTSAYWKFLMDRDKRALKKDLTTPKDGV